ncbi:MAG: chaperone modulator CbpM [Pseudomonadota bacterium]
MSETRYILTLTEISESAHLSVESVIAIVECGIVEPLGDKPEQWRFETDMVCLIHRACRLQSDLELDWPAVALAMELIDNLQGLREENQRLRRQLTALTELDWQN